MKDAYTPEPEKREPYRKGSLNATKSAFIVKTATRPQMHLMEALNAASLYPDYEHEIPTDIPRPKGNGFKVYVADLWFESRKLDVEIDGHVHDPIEDDERDAWLRDNRGIRVVRFTNKRVMQDTLEVVREIQEALA